MNFFSVRFCILTLCLLILTTPTITSAANIPDQQQEKWKEIYDLINQYHVSAPSPEKLTQGSIEGMLESLNDPFTDYFTEQEYESFMNSVEGNYTGIGMVVGERDGGFWVIQVFEGTPAEKAGIKEGDQILRIDDMELKNHSVDEAITIIKGLEGTKVNLTLNRSGKILSLEVTRQKIELPVVDSEILDENIGYLQLATFSHDSMVQFSRELEELRKKRVQGLIIDLRDNPGGLLDAALKMSSLFVEEGPIVHVKDRNALEDTYKVKQGHKWNLPLVILVNENSASASEIVTAALKDYEKATIVGTRTFGKGTVQELIALETGGVLKLTVEEYFSPKHHTINHVGIEPHILVSHPREQLQAALYVLHSDNTLTLQAYGETLINKQKEESTAAPALRKNGTWYVALRPLAYLFHGQVGYDAKKKEAQLTLGSQSASFPISGTETIVENSTTYTSLDLVLKQYPTLKMHEQNGNIILSEQR